MEFENLIRELSTDADSNHWTLAELTIRVRANGSGSFQFNTEPPIEFAGPNTAAETLRRYIDAK
jgi:hypothetical protein